MKRKLRKMGSGGCLAGVCAGFAYCMGIPVWIVRFIWFCSIWFYGVGLGAYILFAIFMPEWDKDPEDFELVTGD